jgi:CheY-like chemotaxis protein
MAPMSHDFTPELRRQAWLRILFITGYAEKATLRNGFLAPGMEMLSKPFALDALGEKIRELIDSHASI